MTILKTLGKMLVMFVAGVFIIEWVMIPALIHYLNGSAPR